jgi:G:T/U-mismatch repair DNA glycosylase
VFSFRAFRVFRGQKVFKVFFWSTEVTEDTEKFKTGKIEILVLGSTSVLSVFSVDNKPLKSFF